MIVFMALWKWKMGNIENM